MNGPGRAHVFDGLGQARLGQARLGLVQSLRRQAEPGSDDCRVQARPGRAGQKNIRPVLSSVAQYSDRLCVNQSVCPSHIIIRMN